jgi:hypothetical protein
MSVDMELSIISEMFMSVLDCFIEFVMKNFLYPTLNYVY